MPLLRILGVTFGLAVVVGTTIGAGILRAPGPVAAHAGSAGWAMAFWIAGGAFALLGAASLADLATTLPHSGGFYVFARRALGDGFGFAIGLADWFNNCAAIAYGAITVAEYLAMLVPWLTGEPAMIAAAIILALAALQMAGMRVSSRLQETVSVVKAIGFMALIAGLLFVADGSAAVTAAAAAPRPSIPAPVAVILAMQLVLIAYDGWQSATYFAGEDRNPVRNLPRSLLGGVLAVIVIYLLMNAALIRVLPYATLAASTLPAADAAAVLLGERGGTIITVLSVLSPLTLVSAVLLCAPRILYAMGADGLIPGRVSFVDGRGTPAVALLVSTITALAMLVSGSFETVVTIGAVFAVVSYAGGFVSLLVLRSRQPELPRPFRSWGYPWTTMLVLTTALALLVGTMAGAPRESFIAIAALAASYPVFRLTRLRGAAADRQ